MARFQCGLCGKVHDHLPMSIASKHPERVFLVPEHERAERVTCTDDLCTIDGREFLIRGVLELPIKDNDDHFDWGVWALVEKADFLRYLEAWERGSEESVPPFSGRLSANLPGYSNVEGLEVMIRLQGRDLRPLFTVQSQQHPLGLDQRHGITMERVHTFLGN